MTEKTLEQRLLRGVRSYQCSEIGIGTKQKEIIEQRQVIELLICLVQEPLAGNEGFERLEQSSASLIKLGAVPIHEIHKILRTIEI